MENKITILIIALLSIAIIGGLYIFLSTQKILPVPQNISQSVKDICKEKGKTGCSSNCVDGFGESCYFDSKDELKSEPGEHSFPEETKQACFAVHSLSVCGDCHNRFELKKDGEFKEVSCEEFFQAIENKNKSCSGCIDEIEAGCC